MKSARIIVIIGLFAIAMAGCQSSQSLDEQAPWVKRDRAASLNWVLSEWSDAEAQRSTHLRELEDDIRARYERSVEDFHQIPLTAYTMFY